MSVGAISNSNNYEYQNNEPAQAPQGGASQSGSAGEASYSSSASSAGSAGETSSSSSVYSPSSTEEKGEDGELLAGKSTQKGTVDYFSGKSVITDADTVIDIATIMDEHKASNMSPEKLAGYLEEKGYKVEVVKMGNRKAIQFENGDFFYDSDGDGNLGTKDVDFQAALSMVEQQYGVDLTALKNSKYTAHYIHSKDDDGGLGALDGLGDADVKKANSETLAILDEIDEELQAAGYRGDKSAYELWMDNELKPKLREYGIDEPSLPENNKAFSDSLALFGAALSVAAANAQQAE